MKKIFALTFAAAMGCATHAVVACETGDYGAISIKDIDGVCTAVIYGDGAASEKAGNPDGYKTLEEFSATVAKVVYTRASATSNKNWTIVLPFDVGTGCSVSGANFYEFGSEASGKDKYVDVNSRGTWTVRIGSEYVKDGSVKKALTAHTPYAFELLNSDRSFTISGCEISIDTHNATAATLTADDSKWQVVGSYRQIVWNDGHKDLGSVYGVAANAKDGVNAGSFVKAKAGASIAPMRAYLQYKPSMVAAKAAAGVKFASAADLESLPETILFALGEDDAPAATFKDGECFEDGDGIIEFKMVNGKKTACIDGQSEARLQTLSIPEDVEVESVVYNRTFSSIGGSWGDFLASTMVLPFSVNKNCVTGADIYQIVNVKHYYDGSKMKVQVQANQWVNDLTANTPYIVTPTAENISFCSELWGNKVTFKLNNSSGTKDVSYSATYEEQGNPTGYPGTWTFKGTYEKLEYGVAPFNGKAYGFASKAKDVDGVQVSAGQFVKAKSGASVPPMRAFLVYDANGVVGAKAAAGVMSSLNDVELPETLEIMLVDKDGVTQAIGTMNTLTGEIKMDDNVWFDMKGRKMNHKPTVKGSYYNKGQKVIIK